MKEKTLTSKKSSDSCIVYDAPAQEETTSEENNSGVDEEKTGTSQIGLAIEDLRNGYLKNLTNLEKMTSVLQSWLSSRQNQVSPSERQQLYSVLVACSKQSASTTERLLQLEARFRSPIVIAKQLKK